VGGDRRASSSRGVGRAGLFTSPTAVVSLTITTSCLRCGTKRQRAKIFELSFGWPYISGITCLGHEEAMQRVDSIFTSLVQEARQKCNWPNVPPSYPCKAPEPPAPNTILNHDSTQPRKPPERLKGRVKPTMAHPGTDNETSRRVHWEGGICNIT